MDHLLLDEERAAVDILQCALSTPYSKRSTSSNISLQVAVLFAGLPFREAGLVLRERPSFAAKCSPLDRDEQNPRHRRGDVLCQTEFHGREANPWRSWVRRQPKHCGRFPLSSTQRQAANNCQASRRASSRHICPWPEMLRSLVQIAHRQARDG